MRARGGATTCAIAVHAHQIDGAHGRHGEGALIDVLAEELDLDEAQTVAIGAIVEQTEADYEELLARTRSEAEELHDGAVGAARALLHDDQLERFDAFVAEMEKRHGADRHHRHGGGH